MSKFTAEEISTLKNACFVANERFREGIRNIAEDQIAEPGKTRLTEQFERQVKETSAVLEKLDEIEHALVMG